MMRYVRFFFGFGGIVFFRGQGSDPNWDTPYPIAMDLLPLSQNLKAALSKWIKDGERLFDPQADAPSPEEERIFLDRQISLFEKIKIELGDKYTVTME